MPSVCSWSMDNLHPYMLAHCTPFIHRPSKGGACDMRCLVCLTARRQLFQSIEMRRMLLSTNTRQEASWWMSHFIQMTSPREQGYPWQGTLSAGTGRAIPYLNPQLDHWTHLSLSRRHVTWSDFAMEGCFWSPRPWIVGKGRLGMLAGMLYCAVSRQGRWKRKGSSAPRSTTSHQNSRQSCARYFGLQ